jgi:hypothetical protein
MCTPAQYSFSVYRGDDYSLVFTVEGDRTASVPTFTLKTSLEATTPTLAVTSPAITQAYDSVNGWTLVTVPLTAAQTAALTAGVYFHDFAYVTAGVKATFLAGLLSLTKDVGT